MLHWYRPAASFRYLAGFTTLAIMINILMACIGGNDTFVYIAYASYARCFGILGATIYIAI